MPRFIEKPRFRTLVPFFLWVTIPDGRTSVGVKVRVEVKVCMGVGCALLSTLCFTIPSPLLPFVPDKPWIGRAAQTGSLVWRNVQGYGAARKAGDPLL